MTVNAVCIAYLFAYAVIVGLGGLFDAWLYYTGGPSVTSRLRHYGNVHPWFKLAAPLFVAFASATFATAFVVHLWIA
jgi:hypothetical protein